MRIKYTGNLHDLMLQIKHIMLDKDIRQKDICNTTGWSRQMVSNLLACRRDGITLETLAMLCSAIGCDMFIDIVDRDKDDTPHHTGNETD